jgi:hypothetical protein
MSGEASERAPEQGSRQNGPIVRPNLDKPYMGADRRQGKADWIVYSGLEPIL